MANFTRMLLLVWLLGSPSIATSVSKRHMSVTIRNDIGSSPIYCHCKSGDDDLQLQTILPYETYGFGFERSFWGTTLFWCNFSGGSKTQGVVVWKDRGHWGNHNRPCHRCVWDVRADGFYRAEAGGPYTFVCPWN